MDNGLDFWIGEWDVRWDGGAGTNTITPELGGGVVLERFESPDLRGLSVSVHDGERWRQAWVDSNDTYLDFTGGWAGDEFELLHVRDDACFRMRFTEIGPDSLVWLWEQRVAAAWELKWRIDYARRSRGSR
jgi:hypothetical protein